jgi:hypothetical protein
MKKAKTAAQKRILQLESQARDRSDELTEKNKEIARLMEMYTNCASERSSNNDRAAMYNTQCSELKVRVRLAEEKLDKYAFEVLSVLRAAVTTKPQVEAILPTQQIQHVTAEKK